MSNARYNGWRKSSFSNDSGNCVEVATGWRESSYSDANGECVEIAIGWRKSSYSDGHGDCVEVAGADRRVAVRDTMQHSHGPVLEFAMDAWLDFLAQAKSGKLDPSVD
jgi:hypothetical protein